MLYSRPPVLIFEVLYVENGCSLLPMAESYRTLELQAFTAIGRFILRRIACLSLCRALCGCRSSLIHRGTPVAGRPVFFNAARQATLFAMGLARPSPSGEPSGAPKGPPGGQARLQRLRGRASGGDVVPATLSLCAPIHRQGASTGRWAPELLIGPPPQSPNLCPQAYGH